MDNLTVILFLCVCIPILPALTLLPDVRSRRFLGFLIVGMAACLIASWFNSVLLELMGGDRLYVTTSFTPIAEEIIKTLPVLYYALVFSDDRETLLSISLAVGLGFALLEDTTILLQNVEYVTIPWAVARGFGAALMHAACTAMAGMGISYVRKRRKLFYCGTFSLLIAAVSFHAVFNLLVQSAHRWLAFVWSALLFVPQLASAVSRKIKNRERSS